MEVALPTSYKVIKQSFLSPTLVGCEQEKKSYFFVFVIYNDWT